MTGQKLSLPVTLFVARVVAVVGIHMLELIVSILVALVRPLQSQVLGLFRPGMIR